MGTYLSQPITEKNSADATLEFTCGSGDPVEVPYGVSDMQGWRQSMEDAYITAANIKNSEISSEMSLFAIFDGHGGREVSKFSAKHFVEEFVKLDDFKEEKYPEALVEGFFHIDEMLRDKRYAKELNRLSQESSDDMDKSTDKTDEEGDEEMEEQEESAGGESNEDGNIGAEDNNTDDADEDEVEDQRKSISESVKKKLDEAEEKGTLSKGEALDLMMKMLRLKRMENKDKDGNAEPALATEAGCTAIAALLVGTRLYVANAGDSRGVLCSQGEAVALSEDHKPMDELELKRIEAAGGYVTEAGRVNGNLNLSRSLGDLKYKTNEDIDRSEQIITAKPDIREFEISAREQFFILACDGVWDILSNTEIVEFVKSQIVDEGIRKVSTIIENIFQRCISIDPYKTQGLGGDNMTCIIVFLKPVEEVVKELTAE